MSAHLLVVDDDDALAGALAKELTDQGYTVDVAHDGEEGLERILAGDYAVIVTDVNMPIMNGVEMLALAQTKLGKLLRSVIIGGYLPEGKPAGLEHAQFLARPLAMPDLVAAVKSELN
jgi:DNA-binding response OmpR family regulator